MKIKHKIYIDNSKFMEFVDEMATQMTEREFKEHTWSSYRIQGVVSMKDEPQQFYNEKYDEIESMLNEIMGVYTDNDEKK